MPSWGAFQLSVLEINSWEGTKNIGWETANFLYNFVSKINATKQLSWTFLPTFGRNFFTQFSPVDPFENELYEETIKSFSSKNVILPQQSCLKIDEGWQKSSDDTSKQRYRDRFLELFTVWAKIILTVTFCTVWAKIYLLWHFVLLVQMLVIVQGEEHQDFHRVRRLLGRTPGRWSQQQPFFKLSAL